MHQYYVYILASERNGTLYVGMTNNLIRRLQEHRSEIQDGFTKKYHVHMLVWYESFSNSWDAITAEKRIKNWKGEYKLNLIEETNPDWKDLYDEIIMKTCSDWIPVPQGYHSLRSKTYAGMTETMKINY